MSKKLFPWYISNPRPRKLSAKIYTDDSMSYNLVTTEEMKIILKQHHIKLINNAKYLGHRWPSEEEREIYSYLEKEEYLATIDSDNYSTYLLYNNTTEINGNLEIEGEIQEDVEHEYSVLMVVLGDLIVKGNLTLSNNSGLIVTGNVTTNSFHYNGADLIIEGNLLAQQETGIFFYDRSYTIVTTEIGSIQTKKLIVNQIDCIKKFNISYKQAFKREKVKEKIKLIPINT